MREAPYVYSVPVFPEASCSVDGPCEEAVRFERVDYHRAGRWSAAPGHIIYTAPGVDPTDARPSPPTAAERQAWLDRIDPDHTIASPDAHSVRFSEMSAEAEAELAAWDEMLHGRHK